MSLAPLLNAPTTIVIHAAAAMIALGIGAVQLAAPKGTLPHRTLGWVWALTMTVVAVSSFWIHTICTFGPFSAIHGLSLFTLAVLPLAVLHARRHRVARHRRAMLFLFAGALMVAGLFTLLPGRIMHDVVFGTTAAHRTCS
ncbi:MAG: DUF2306 domain-containing protein [Hyphomicrobiaceae bacterium]|jgi:uncharacterized membrane protein